MEGAQLWPDVCVVGMLLRINELCFLFPPFSFGLVSGLFPFISELDQANHI